MAKRRHEEEQQSSSKTAMALMAVGGLVVAALVVWALTRTVQPAPEPAPTAEAPVTIEQPTSGAFPTVTPTAGTTGTAPTATAAVSTSSQPPVPPPSHEGTATVTRISVADLRSRFDAKQVTVIDVRDKTSYMGSHIPGALSIPMAQVESYVSSLSKDKPIVTYCT